MRRHAPRIESTDSSNRGGNLEAECPGGEGCVFDRYCGSECEDCPGGCGYGGYGYDCSPCNSPDWGCTGYRHPHGYVSNNKCICANGQCGPQHMETCPQCRRQFCGTGPAPGCSCCPFCGCGPSGDHNYNFAPGPPVAQTAYPYYTLRGPRDFLQDNPPSIGPY
jgi:hypothetical protein